MNKTTTLCLLLLSLIFKANAQNDLEDLSLYHDMYHQDSVIDSIYGIERYAPLNKRLGGDSIRHGNDGYAADGWIEDYYMNEQLLHKGYYVEGMLRAYNNYYPNGQEERDFGVINDFRSKMVKYYPDGTKKSEVLYIGQDAWKWEDYYPNGQLEYYEKWDKDFEYYEEKEQYYQNGNPQSILELEKKRKMLFTQKDYYENGNLKQEGELKYQLFQYKKIGKWKIYNEQGKLEKIEVYQNGSLHETIEK